jgi:hypothetical protein
MNYFVEMDLPLMKASVPYLRHLQVQQTSPQERKQRAKLQEFCMADVLFVGSSLPQIDSAPAP